MCDPPGFSELLFPFCYDMFDLKGVQTHLFETKIPILSVFLFFVRECDSQTLKLVYKIMIFTYSFNNPIEYNIQ